MSGRKYLLLLLVLILVVGHAAGKKKRLINVSSAEAKTLPKPEVNWADPKVRARKAAIDKEKEAEAAARQSEYVYLTPVAHADKGNESRTYNSPPIKVHRSKIISAAEFEREPNYPAPSVRTGKAAIDKEKESPSEYVYLTPVPHADKGNESRTYNSPPIKVHRSKITTASQYE